MSDRQGGQVLQQSFETKEEKIRQALAPTSRHDFDHVFAFASGGTDSLTAIDAYDRFYDEFDLPPIDMVIQTNTGTTLPSTLETARGFCRDRGLSYIEVRNQKEGRMLAHRVLEYGFPADSQGSSSAGGHWPEFINRKLDTWDKVYTSFSGQQLWISGGRYAESDRRAGNLGDGAFDLGKTGDRKPRKSWLAPIHGLLDEEKAEYIEENNIPETIAYDWLGYSGDCVACAFDAPQVLNEVRILAPNLAWALERLIGWVYLRIRRGEIDQPLERAVWGTPIEDHDDPSDDAGSIQRDLAWGGCADCSSDCYTPVTDGGSE